MMRAFLGLPLVSVMALTLGVGTTGADVGLSDFRFYVHDVRLVEAGTAVEVLVALTQDGLWQYTADTSAPEDGVVLLYSRTTPAPASTGRRRPTRS